MKIYYKIKNIKKNSYINQIEPINERTKKIQYFRIQKN